MDAINDIRHAGKTKMTIVNFVVYEMETAYTSAKYSLVYDEAPSMIFSDTVALEADNTLANFTPEGPRVIYTTDESDLRYWLMDGVSNIFMGEILTDTVGNMCAEAADPEVNYV